jgi:putative exporter of polyketide antibiotics
VTCKRNSLTRSRQVPVENQAAWDVIISLIFCAIFAFIGFMSIREFLDMRRGIVPKIVFD